MAFVDCGKYTKEQAEQDAKIAEIEKVNKSQSEDITKNAECCKSNAKSIDDLNNKALKSISVKSPLTGNGKQDNPLGLSLGDGMGLDSSGRLIATGIVPKTLTNINSGYTVGLNLLKGSMGESLHDPQNYIKGFPKNIDSEDKEQDASSSISDVTTDPPNAYDWSAVVSATDGQVVFQLTGVTGTAWQIVNDSGIDSNGNVKDPNAWGKWQKLDNPSGLSNAMLTNLQSAVDSLKTRVSALENNITPVYDASGKTVQFYAARGV